MLKNQLALTFGFWEFDSVFLPGSRCSPIPITNNPRLLRPPRSQVALGNAIPLVPKLAFGNAIVLVIRAPALTPAILSCVAAYPPD
jgi:hypothetical protein